MDPLCLPISDSQPCLGTLCGSLRRKVTPLICYSAIRLGDRAWNYTTQGPPSAASCKVAAGYGCGLERCRCSETSKSGRWREASQKLWNMPLNNQRPNQFVQRPREAGGLQRNVWSGRSLSVHPSPYLRQTHNSQSAREKRWLGGMGLRRGTKPIFYFPFLSFILSQFLLDVAMHVYISIFLPTLFRLHIYIFIFLNQ